MKSRDIEEQGPAYRSLRVRAVGPLGACVVALTTSCGNEPPLRCTAQTGEAIARYRLLGAPRPAAGATPSACADVTAKTGLPGQGDPTLIPLGVETYFPSPVDPHEHEQVSALGLQPEWIGNRIQDARLNAAVDPALASQSAVLANYPYGTSMPPALLPDAPTDPRRPYAYGKFDSVYPDARDICSVSQMTPSTLDYPDIPMHMAGGTMQADTPATSVAYAWSNVQVIVSAESLGAQTFGTLTVTRDGCRADYQVAILVPRVPCSKLDASGATVGPDPSACDPSAATGSPYGSGIHPGIDVRCENIGTASSPDFECLPTRMAP